MTELLLQLNENLYLKDPQSTDLGKKIMRHSILLIDELGFEAFTFKKLSIAIESTEASIYRYFENKHRLLVYLIAWYWNWIEYRLEFHSQNLTSAEDRLDVAIRILTEDKVYDDAFPNVDEAALFRIVIAESDKTYLTKDIDEINKEGLFKGYKSLCQDIAGLVREINPTYPNACALVSTALEAAHQQIFFALHLPSLTELSKEPDPYQANYKFIKNLIWSAIK